MESLMNYDGIWSPDLLNLMIPMAEEAELAEKERTVEAVAVFFSKECSKDFFDGRKSLRESIRERLYAARGLDPADFDDSGEQAANALDKAFGGTGVRQARKPRGKR